jgi:hypothetical protein
MPDGAHVSRPKLVALYISVLPGERCRTVEGCSVDRKLSSKIVIVTF